MTRTRWSTRVAPSLAPILLLAAAVWISGCETREVKEAAPNGAERNGTAPATPTSALEQESTTTRPAATPPPQTPVVFDASTTVSEMENVLFEERELSEIIPLARQLEAGVTSYYEDLSDQEKPQFSALVEEIRKAANTIATEAEQKNLETVQNAVYKLRDEHMRELRKRDLERK